MSKPKYPSMRTARSFCYLCRVTHKDGICPLSPVERERVIADRLALGEPKRVRFNRKLMG